jgi:transposase
VNENIIWVGLDAHKAFIQVAVLNGEERGAGLSWRVEHTAPKVKKLGRKLARLAKGREIRACYEAGPCGWALKRKLEDSVPLVCDVIAPSLIPVKPGDHVKTDRRDAQKLAEYLRSGLLTEVAPPTEEQEAVRDLVRQRCCSVQDLVRARHRLSKFLLRRHLTHPGKNWTDTHMAWVNGLELESATDQVVLRDLLAEVEHQMQRRNQLTRALEEVAMHEPYATPVGFLQCFRGIRTVTAMTILAELFSIERFDTAKKLMGYLGLTPSEHTSGVVKRGGITKAGNRRVRTVLTEAAQHSSRPPRIGPTLRARRANQPPEVVAMADRAMQRQHALYWRLMNRGKHRNVAVTACARELSGFIWALLHEKTPSLLAG